MKNVLKLMLAAAMCVSAGAASAQNYLEDPKYGATPAEREQTVRTMNFLKDAVNNQAWDEVSGYLNYMFTHAPKASQNTYIYGANLYKQKIARAKTLDEKKTYVDSLMYVYDMRMEHFGDHATQGRNYLLCLKGREYLAYAPADRENVIKYLKEAVDANGDGIDPKYVNIYFQQLTTDYANDLVETDEVMNEYERLAPLFELDDTPERANEKKTFEALFTGSGAANCENLEKLYKSRLAAAPDDDELLGKAFSLMARANCRGEFFYTVAEKYYAKNPSANTAMLLAQAFEADKMYDKAAKYLNETVANEQNPADKEALYVRIAGINLALNKAKEAADAARKAIDINPESGLAYLALANSYAIGASGCSGFDKQAVYWLAVDTLTKARQLLLDNSEQVSKINQQIAACSASFPSKEECFFRGLDDGKSYPVKCGWISGTTTVRTGK